MWLTKVSILAYLLNVTIARSNIVRHAIYEVQEIAVASVGNTPEPIQVSLLPAISHFLEPTSISSGLRPTGIRTRPWTNSSTSIRSLECACTVNAEAGLVWWYPETLFNVLGKISTVFQDTRTSFTYQPYTTTFDAAQALQTAGASMSYGERWDSIHNTTEYFATAVVLATPTAALTVFTSVSDIRARIPTGLFGVNELVNVFTLRAPTPTYVVSVPGGSLPLSATPYDNILYLTQIEIAYGISDKLFVEQSPGHSCGPTAPAIQSLERAIAIPFVLNDDLRTVATPTGTLDPSLLGRLPSHNGCVPGTWSAPSPTMIVVVEVTVERNRDVEILVHQEKTETSLDGPRPPPTNTPSDTVPLIGAIGPGSDEGIKTTTTSPLAGPATGMSPSYNLVSSRPTPIAAEPPAGPAIVYADQTISAQSGQIGFVIDGQTLSAGQAVTQAGSKIISIDAQPTPNAININGITQQLESITQPPVLYVFGSAVPEQSDGAFVIGKQTLVPGQSVIVAGNTVSLGTGPQPSVVVVNGMTSSLRSTILPVLSISGTTYTATSLPGPYVVFGQTLLPGGSPITVSGTTLSLQPGGTVFVVNGHTSTLGSPTISNTTSTRAPLQQTHAGLASLRHHLPFSYTGLTLVIVFIIALI